MRVPPPSVLGLGPTGMELLELFPSPRGLLLGLGCVVVGQVAVLAYYFVRRSVFKSQNFIQYSPPPTTTLADDLYSHITSPESFMLVFGYLTTVWMLNLLPPAYYVLGGSVSWWQVLLQLLRQLLWATLWVLKFVQAAVASEAINEGLFSKALGLVPGSSK